MAVSSAQIAHDVGEFTFCLVWFPAPGHSVMMSSFASVLVAKAKATPEKVVPCKCAASTRTVARPAWCVQTYEIDADDQLSLAPSRALNLYGLRPRVCLRACGRRVAIATVAWLLRLWGIAGRAGGGRLAVHLALRRVVALGSVNRRWRHWTRGARRVGAGSKVLLARRGIGVRGRAAQRVVGIHGERGVGRTGVGGRG